MCVSLCQRRRETIYIEAVADFLDHERLELGRLCLCVLEYRRESRGSRLVSGLKRVSLVSSARRRDLGTSCMGGWQAEGPVEALREEEKGVENFAGENEGRNDEGGKSRIR